MTNPVNVEVIVDKQLFYLRTTTDVFLRTDLVSRITQAAEKYAPSNSWYIQTMTTVFELGGDLVQPEVANNLMRLIAEGSGEDDEADEELRIDAVESFLSLLEKPVLPDILLQVRQRLSAATRTSSIAAECCCCLLVCLLLSLLAC